MRPKNAINFADQNNIKYFSATNSLNQFVYPADIFNDKLNLLVWVMFPPFQLHVKQE
jgi:hypothetical protein